MNWILVHTCSVRRRSSSGLNELGEPTYGKSSTWSVVYSTLPCRFASKAANVEYRATGERNAPTYSLYVASNTPLQVQDRVFIGSDFSGTGTTQEFVVSGARVALSSTGAGISHLEYDLQLP